MLLKDLHWRQVFIPIFAVMETENIPECLLALEPYVRQYCELMKLESELDSVLRVKSTEETSIHMDIRLSAEKELCSRRDYISCCITEYVADIFIRNGILSKYPELRTNRNEN